MCVGGGGREEEDCVLDICDLDQTLKPTVEKDFMQFSKRYSPGISTFSKDIACYHQALCQTKQNLKIGCNSHNY